ncbi:MAG: WecB/TagA/CpsF family glycosyltransferase [Bacteroidales bacterium]|nr:WecB/TagA/CpsF family glycosyltransferase [Bacteroidales bacterium]
MLKLKDVKLVGSRSELEGQPWRKELVNTINAYSYVMAQKDAAFAEALSKGDLLVPDGVGAIRGARIVGAPVPQERIAGYDLFDLEMRRLEERGGRCFFLGSGEAVLSRIRERAAVDYPHIAVHTYSPPYKGVFSDEDNARMIAAVNAVQPDLLWIGMTAPKQEKWAYAHFDELDVKGPVGCIGAVFDFYAGTVKRAPQWWQDHGLEWLYRFAQEPRRMWKRNVQGNLVSPFYFLRERFFPDFP